MLSVKHWDWIVWAVLLLSLGEASSAFAFYKCEKPDGGMSYVNSLEDCDTTVGAEKVPSYEPKQETQVEAVPVKPIEKPKKSAPVSTLVPSSSPPKKYNFNLSAADSKRSQVLLYELQQEIKMQGLMQKAINGAAAGDEERLQVLREQRQTHTLNIAAIKQELARLGVYADNTGN
ncbi:hypothetical protein NQX30_00490 [Candidatus Persebacteraceae bacterium Df01]|jgi:hypothetical protein|uniref:DUF4124 domain-containing protein n=1 Tax=Candidatus Doriopsillibacter californiensis TaxID=2970740 RepID=A0ABT7QK30_9GAMM|nr:hypothetical protein [Candidatus Persebacteraceae bacterium Df01]